MTLQLEFDVQYLSFPLSQNEGVDINWTTNVGSEEISISSANTNWKSEYRNSETNQQAIRSRLQTGTKRTFNTDVPFRSITLNVRLRSSASANIRTAETQPSELYFGVKTDLGFLRRLFGYLLLQLILRYCKRRLDLYLTRGYDCVFAFSSEDKLCLSFAHC